MLAADVALAATGEVLVPRDARRLLRRGPVVEVVFLEIKGAGQAVNDAVEGAICTDRSQCWLSDITVGPFAELIELGCSG